MVFLRHQCKCFDNTSNCVTLIPNFYIISILLVCNHSNTRLYICEGCATLFKIINSYKIPCFLILLNPLNPELNPICYLLALLGAQHFLYVSRIRVKLLTFRRLMSYIYIYIYMEHPFLMFLDHTQRRSRVGRTPVDE